MLRLRNRTYHVQFRDLEGRVRTSSLHTQIKERAIQLEHAFMIQLHARKSAARLSRKFPGLNPAADAVRLDLPQYHKRGGMSLADMFEYAVKRRPLSADHASAWRHFCENIPAKFADQITPKLAQEYLDSYFGDKKAKTYNNHKTLLNTVFRICLVQAGLTASPFASIVNRTLTDVQSHRNLTEEELQAVMDAGDIQIRTMTMLARWTGQRLETCARMRWSDIDDARRVFLIKPGKTARFGKFVAVPIFQPLADYLKTIRPAKAKPDATIIGSVSKWYSAATFSHRFNKILDKLGIRDPRACFHSLRGNFITWMKDAGIPAEQRQAITGHSTLSVEDIYSESVHQISLLAAKY